MLCQESHVPKRPYSAGDIKRVKIGVEIIEIPFCKKEQTKNHKDAFI